MTTSIIPIQGYTWPPFIPAFSSSCVLKTVAGMCLQSGDGGNLPWLADCSHPDTHTLIPQQIPAGRDKTRAHPEQSALPCPALPCLGPQDLCSCGSQQGASCTLCLLAGSSGGEKGKALVFPTANSGPHIEKTRSAQVAARKTRQSVMGSVFLAHPHCLWFCDCVSGWKPCLFCSISPLP